jgi:type IV secretion system protein VirD4
MSKVELNAPSLMKQRTGAGWLALVQLSVVVGLLSGLSYGTQWFAKTFAYNEVLGVSWHHWYAPWDILLWWKKYHTFYPDQISGAMQRVMFTSLAFVGTSFLFAMRIWSRGTATEGLHGSARWSVAKDLRENGLLPKIELSWPELILKEMAEPVRLTVALSCGLTVEVLLGLTLRSLTVRGLPIPWWASLTVLLSVLGVAMWVYQKIETRIKGARDVGGVVVGGWQMDRWHINWLKIAGLSIPMPQKKTEVVMLRHDGKEHILTFAPTRSGKGVGLILPTLLTWKESMICTDIKGELWELTSGYRKSIGNTCLRFEPSKRSVTNPDGTRSVARWNPIDEVRIRPHFVREPVGSVKCEKGGRWTDDQGEIEVRRDTDGFIVWDDDKGVGDAQNLAMLIVDPLGKGLEDHWAKTAHAISVGLILHVVYMWQSGLSDKRPNLRLVDQIISDPNISLKDLWSQMILGGSDPKNGIKGYYRNEAGVVDPREREEQAAAKKNAQKTGRPAAEKALTTHKGSGHPSVMSAAQDMVDRPENEGGSVISTAKSNLALYRDPIVGENTSYSDFSVLDLMYHENPVSLYLILPPSDKDRLMPLVRIMLNACMRNLVELRPQLRPEDEDMLPPGRKKKHRLLGMLDEFPSVGKLPIIQEGLAYVAGYGIKLYLITQDLAQIQDKYGKEESITSNCHVQNAYNPLRTETAKYLSERCGKSTVIQDKRSSSGTLGKIALARNTSDQINEVARDLMTPDEVMTMQGPVKDSKGMIVKPGRMLLMIAGIPVVYGTQSLFFLFSEILERYNMKALGFSDVCIRGVISDTEKSAPPKAGEPVFDEAAVREAARGEPATHAETGFRRGRGPVAPAEKFAPPLEDSDAAGARSEASDRAGEEGEPISEATAADLLEKGAEPATGGLVESDGRQVAVVLRVATTGPTEERVVEVAGVELHNGVVTGRTFSRRVNPEAHIEMESVARNGITDADVADCPKFADIAQELLEFIGSASIVVEHRELELIPLDKEFARLKVMPVSGNHPVIVVSELAKGKYPQDEGNLAVLYARFNLGLGPNESHESLRDAVKMAAAYQELAALGSLPSDPGSGNAGAEIRPGMLEVDPDRRMRREAGGST